MAFLSHHRPGQNKYVIEQKANKTTTAAAAAAAAVKTTTKIPPPLPPPPPPPPPTTTTLPPITKIPNAFNESFFVLVFHSPEGRNVLAFYVTIGKETNSYLKKEYDNVSRETTASFPAWCLKKLFMPKVPQCSVWPIIIIMDI